MVVVKKIPTMMLIGVVQGSTSERVTRLSGVRVTTHMEAATARKGDTVKSVVSKVMVMKNAQAIVVTAESPPVMEVTRTAPVDKNLRGTVGILIPLVEAMVLVKKAQATDAKKAPVTVATPTGPAVAMEVVKSHLATVAAMRVTSMEVAVTTMTSMVRGNNSTEEGALTVAVMKATATGIEPPLL